MKNTKPTEQTGPKDCQALAIDLICAEVVHAREVLEDYVNKPRKWNSIYTLAIRNTAEALALRDENAALREQVVKVRWETIEEFIAGKGSRSNSTHVVLRDLINKGVLQKGKYLIEVCW